MTILALVCLVIVFACSETDLEHKPITEFNGVVPDKVTDVQIEALAGGAKLTYTEPINDTDFLYVKAIFTKSNGTEVEVKASKNNGELYFYGNGDDKEVTVKIYSVDESEMQSEPEVIKFNPLQAPVKKSFETLTIIEDFGGIRVLVDNCDTVALGSQLSVLDSATNQEILVDEIWRNIENISYSFRGLEIEETTFIVRLRDRYDNYSDPYQTVLTPLFEEELDRTKIKILPLPGDREGGCWGGAMSKLFDGNWNTFCHTCVGGGFPHSFSFDLGNKLKVRRYIVHQRQDNKCCNWYKNANPKIWKLYGSNDPNPDGSWESWTLIGDYECYKPSGLPGTETTPEDIAYQKPGEEFLFSLDTKAYRYIRWVTYETWAGNDFTHIGELDFYGQIVED